MKASILKQAEELINGDRRREYGPVDTNFRNAADMFTVILHKKLMPGLRINAREAALLQIAWKLCRESNQHKLDNLVDGAAYFELANQVSDLEYEKPEPFPIIQSDPSWEKKVKSKSKPKLKKKEPRRRKEKPPGQPWSEMTVEQINAYKALQKSIEGF